MDILKTLSRKPFSVVGHRGAKGRRPENTVSAIKFAIDCGADIVEVDVRSTRDGELILLHDPDFKRVSGKEISPSQLDFRSIRESITVYGEPVATLDEALETVKDKICIFVEIKEIDTVEKVMDRIRTFKCENQTAVISFYEEALSRVKEINPQITTGLIYAKPPGKIIEAKKLKADIVLPGYWLATEKAVSFAHRMGLKVVSWVINDEEHLRLAVSRKIDAVATDYPDLIVKLREKF
ncbi:MAG TPA: glycerophosphodiester phosphodiesterase [Persephonella sp.]|uniref:Glycerophosphoryl diester phosphodiesterase n=1 Tax=Persephonella marina (strain DSM 14350 / EX-H1) TaxID=123214 RepID=C0QTW9_PERMH|nr:MULTISPECIES: glycerophosphodiester phosphodiesterase [Persephonella]ACO03117.1 glycerophosphoryl diester phosphodiesterase [Persephonella marina EX-H1]HCB70249.1 glycerophosphodiester phosphodiesterase [Persephonella sp.]